MSDRPVTDAVRDALLDAAKRPVLFYEGEFASGIVQMWSGIGPFAWNAKTWLGAGNLAGVRSIGETTDVVAQGCVFTLAGCPSDLLEIVEDETRHGQPGRLWIGFRDEAGALIDDPIQLFAGALDVPQVVETATGPTIEISYENCLIDVSRPRLYSYTSADQKLFYPDDLGFDFVPGLQEKIVKWGAV